MRRAYKVHTILYNTFRGVLWAVCISATGILAKIQQCVAHRVQLCGDLWMGLSHSPLLEVKRTGSLLIVKSGSSNPSKRHTGAASCPAAPKSTRTQNLKEPFCVSKFRRLALLFQPGRPLRQTSSFKLSFSSPQPTPPLSSSSPPLLPPPPPLLLLAKVSLSLPLSQTDCMHSGVAFRDRTSMSLSWIFQESDDFKKKNVFKPRL